MGKISRVCRVSIVFLAFMVMCVAVFSQVLSSRPSNNSASRVSSSAPRLVGDETGHRLSMGRVAMSDSKYTLLIKKIYNSSETIT